MALPASDDDAHIARHELCMVEPFHLLIRQVLPGRIIAFTALTCKVERRLNLHEDLLLSLCAAKNYFFSNSLTSSPSPMTM